MPTGPPVALDHPLGLLPFFSVVVPRGRLNATVGQQWLSISSSGLCRRRRWPDPLYESYQTSSGFCCTVRVNHREYQTDTVYETETLARENAAMRAYLICRNFSVNDGMYPVGHKKGAIVQGLPVAIGTGRHSASNYETSSTSSGGGGYGSGGSSPRSSDSGRDDRQSHVRAIPRRNLAYGL
ncbi:MAG: hypothetical protein M1833_004532 [Piccolia ochrophora]|nr:MAG: hypothetical protein M1833_004532 [Piccolia ochrophora]